MRAAESPSMGYAGGVIDTVEGAQAGVCVWAALPCADALRLLDVRGGFGCLRCNNESRGASRP